ncbi:MAG TPA: polyprenyl diphosphate synthase [Treponemataceae bacterium]|nr:polyprenyl diphosphate synthase [Treponemataceae bacterium]
MKTASEVVLSSSDSSNNPVHIGIIMDGNGRWAKRRGQTRTQGHKRGLEVAKAIVKKASELHIPYVTLYAFSTENWKRTTEEVGFLMNLIKTHLKAELAFYAENKIRVQHIGNLRNLPPDIQEEITAVVSDTAHFTNTTVVLAINYGGKDEIVRAIKKIPLQSLTSLDENTLSLYMDISDLPPVDLLIRTGGDQRISNFLLWQSAYAEIYFDPDLWPDWTETHLLKAINSYNSRERRFGSIK